MKRQYHDRFSEASKEVAEKSGFTCVSCDTAHDTREAEKEHHSYDRTKQQLVEESFGP